MQTQTIDSAKQRAADNLVRIADAMETCDSADVAFAKELKREYKATLDVINEGEDPNRYCQKPDVVKKSKAECYEKILAALNDLPAWLKKVEEIHPSECGHIEFAYASNYKKMAVEVQFMIPDQFYSACAGVKAVRNSANLLFLKQHEIYSDLERGLLQFTMIMIGRDKILKKQFWDKYVAPYNERVQKKRDQKKESND
jgi:hypothetical protein